MSVNAISTYSPIQAQQTTSVQPKAAIPLLKNDSFTLQNQYEETLKTGLLGKFTGEINSKPVNLKQKIESIGFFKGTTGITGTVGNDAINLKIEQNIKKPAHIVGNYGDKPIDVEFATEGGFFKRETQSLVGKIGNQEININFPTPEINAADKDALTLLLSLQGYKIEKGKDGLYSLGLSVQKQIDKAREEEMAMIAMMQQQQMQTQQQQMMMTPGMGFGF